LTAAVNRLIDATALMDPREVNTPPEEEFGRAARRRLTLLFAGKRTGALFGTRRRRVEDGP